MSLEAARAAGHASPTSSSERDALRASRVHVDATGAQVLVVADPSTSLAPRADPSRYEVLRPLGRGASGSVYLSLDKETGGYVALKKLFRLDQRRVGRFKREFRSLTDLHHPNLVKLFDLHGDPDGQAVAVTQDGSVAGTPAYMGARAGVRSEA